MSSQNKNNPSNQNKQGFKNTPDNKQEVVSITYEEIGLFPRSFSRVLDRFLKQVFSDVENLVIQEYRFYRYLFLTTFKSLLILFFVPFFVNFLAKNYVVRPLTEYFWNTKQTEIFLNSYQQKRAFAELKDFEEKLYFESLIYPKSPERVGSSGFATPIDRTLSEGKDVDMKRVDEVKSLYVTNPSLGSQKASAATSIQSEGNLTEETPFTLSTVLPPTHVLDKKLGDQDSLMNPTIVFDDRRAYALQGGKPVMDEGQANSNRNSTSSNLLRQTQPIVAEGSDFGERSTKVSVKRIESESLKKGLQPQASGGTGQNNFIEENKGLNSNLVSVSDEKTESLINSYTLKSSLFVYQTREADKNIQQRYQEKTIELAQRYNDQSIEAITNFFADLISLLTLLYLLYALEIQINITKSFLLEVFFGLDDSKKSLLILLVTDLLVGYHSSNLWELFFEFLFNHYGLPESQTGIFLLVATLPVLLDVLFKYLIFRHLNRSSPATVATYRAMIE